MADSFQVKEQYMKYDVIVIAGTTESREVIVQQLKEEKRVLACVATELGAEMLQEYPVDVHTGRMDEEEFRRFFTENLCKKVIDASHPFAKVVTQTVKKVTGELSIPYERYERPNINYDYDQILSVADAGEAVDLLNQIEGNILLTTGVNTAAVYARGVKEAKERLYIRVLDNESSLEGCRKAGYPESHVFGEMPPFSMEDNLRLIRQTRAQVLVTKDSGKTGGVDTKVKACREAGIKMLLIRRPEQE